MTYDLNATVQPEERSSEGVNLENKTNGIKQNKTTNKQSEKLKKKKTNLNFVANFLINKNLYRVHKGNIDFF